MDGMKSAQKSVAPYYNTPPRAKRQPVQTDAHISSSKGQSTGGVTTPPRRRTNSSDSSPKTAHYSPTRGLMSTPQTHHIQKRPMSASPGVAFMKRTATVEQQTGLRQIKMSSTLDGHGHSQGQPHLEETKANNQQMSNQHDSPGGLKGRSLVTPCRNKDTPPRGGIKAHTTSKLELKSADLPSLATERLGVESFDMLEHGIVLPTPLSKVHESSQQSKNMLQERDSAVMFHTSSDLLVHCPMCGETVSAADDQPAHGGDPSLEFTSKYMNNHMLEVRKHILCHPWSFDWLICKYLSFDRLFSARLVRVNCGRCPSCYFYCTLLLMTLSNKLTEVCTLFLLQRWL